MNLSCSEVRNLFPQIKHLDHLKESYLDSASTTLKFDFVIDLLQEMYRKQVSNVHRGDHHLSLEATKKYEQAREEVANFLKAQSPKEIVFTSGTTEGLNLLAHSLGEELKEGDEILISEMEHHSNFLPWQLLAQKKNLKLKVIPLTKEGGLDLKKFEEILSSKTKIFSITHVSNVTGAINPIEDMVKKAKSKGAYTIVDAAQSAALLDLNVQKIDCDFLVFSGHKIFAPAGIGVLFGRESILSNLPLYKVGGGTVTEVSLDSIKWADTPHRFEAGTPFIEGAVVLGKVLSFFRKNIDCKSLFDYEKKLVDMAISELSEIPNLKIIGSQDNRSNIVSFVIKNFNSEDLSFIMTKEKVAIRAGHHCCMTFMKKLNLSSGTVRASFSVYNREEDVRALKTGVLKSLEILGDG